MQRRHTPADSQVLEGTDVTSEGAVTLFLATDNAVLYIYQIQSHGGTAPPTFALEDECHLLPRG